MIPALSWYPQVGSAFDNANTKAELDMIATDPSKHVFQVTNYGALDEIMETLENDVCIGTV